MSIFTKIQNRLPAMLTVLIVLGGMLAIGVPELAFAADPPTGLQNIEQGLGAISTFLSVVLTFLNYLIWPILVVIGALMDTNLIFGGGMEDRLLAVWSQIRNITNLAFVIGIIGVALYNVIGIDSDGNYAIKKFLPKFVLALVLVNFSFFAGKLVIDASNVLTTSIFALPNAVQQEFNDQNDSIITKNICNADVFSNPLPSAIESQVAPLNLGDVSNSFCADEDSLTAEAKNFFQRFSHNNMALVMAIEFGQIAELTETSQVVRENPTLINLTINVLLSAALYVVYVASFLSLLLVLVARLVVLWIVLALSPLAALQVILPDGIANDSNLDVVDLFTKHVIAPIKIALGMSIGYIMLSAIQQVGPSSINIDLGQQFAAPFSGVNTMQKIIMAVACVGIVYRVSLSAADGTLADRAVDSIRGFVQQQAGFIGRLPLSAPIFPAATTDSNDGGISIAGTGRYLRDIQSGYEQKGNIKSGGNDGASGGPNLGRSEFAQRWRQIRGDRNRALDIFRDLTKANAAARRDALKEMNINDTITHLRTAGAARAAGRLEQAVPEEQRNQTLGNYFANRAGDERSFFQDINSEIGSQFRNSETNSDDSDN